MISFNKGNILFFIGILFVVSSIFFVSALTTISNCVEINESGTYTMNQSINQSENFDCIKIIAANVTLDCNGYNITSNLAVSGVFSNQTNTTVKNCYVDMGPGLWNYGIEFVSVNNSNIINTTLNNQYRGIDLYSSSNNTLTNITSNSNIQSGIRLFLSSNNTLINVTTNSNSWYGTYLSAISNNNTLINITSNSNGFSGIRLFSSSNNNIFSNTNVWNCSTMGAFSCIYVAESDYNIFDGGFINKSDKYGIQMFSSGSLSNDNADHNIFRNINITNIINTSVFLDDDGTNSENLNNTFLNVSYNNESVDSKSELIRQWYYQVYVNDSSGNLVGNASVVFYDKNNILILNVTTNASGWTDIINLTDYINLGGTKTYYSNYTVYAYKNNYSGSVSFNTTLEKNKLNITITIPISNVWCAGADMNRDGKVDTADYIIWRKLQNCVVSSSSLCSNADANRDGTVNQADYDLWKANFGKTGCVGSIGTGGGNENTTVNSSNDTNTTTIIPPVVVEDNDQPTIIKNNPSIKSGIGRFEVWFKEKNPDKFVLKYGNQNKGYKSVELNINECRRRGNLGRRDCVFNIDLTGEGYSNKEKIYTWFELTDAAGNSAVSKIKELRFG